jgi:tetratricopeptide (TPR) repeat protein
MAHLELGNISKALEEGKKAIDISQSTGDTLYMCRAHTDFMNALRDNGEFDKALKHGLTALTMYNALGDRENEAFTYTEIADLYLTIKDYPGALEYGSRGKNLLDSIKSHNVVRLWNAKAIAKAHLGLGDHTVAGEYAHNAQKIAERLNATRELMELLDLRAAIAEKNGNLALALHTFKEFKTMSDSLAASSNAQKMMSIQAAFDLEATTAETTRLSELNAMNEAHLRRQRKLNDFLWIGSTALICTILVLLFFGQQTKKLRSRVEARNQRLQKQQELLEEKELELEQQQVRLTSTLMSDAHKAKQIERATESFEHAVQHQYQAVRSLVDIIIRSDESGKQMLQDRISNIEATVLNTFSGSPTFRRDLQELITLLATSMASDLTRRTTPLVRVSSEINEIGDEERFLIGLLVHELVSISYASLQFDQHIQFIKIEIAYISPTEINLSYHTNQDPITNNFHSEEIANAVSIIEYLVDKLNARATWTDLEFRTFQLVMNAEPNMAYRSIA